MKKPYQIALGFVAALIILGFLKNILIQSLLQTAIGNLFPVSVRIGSTDVSLIKSSLQLRDLKVMNPSSSSEKLMVDLPLIYIDFDPMALRNKQAHFEEVRLNLKELVVVKEKDGKLNLDAFKPAEANKEADKAGTKDTKKAEQPKLKIDKLYLSIERVVYKDYSQGSQPAVQTFDINIKDRLFTNIDNPAAISGAIMIEAISKTALNKIVSLDVSLVTNQAKGLLDQAAGMGGGASEKAEKAVKGLFNILK